jgi:anion-transporting  ArsA/GET3 family ATPase
MTAKSSQQKIVFVTGKGGVGKSLIAAAIASERAKLGRKTLLVELGDTSYYQDLFSLPELTHHPMATKYGFDLALWGGESSLREYVLHYLRMEKLYNLFFDNRVMRALVNVAPGLPEIAMLGKITSGIRNVGPQLNYDDIIVDSFASGHALALLKTPRGMKEAIPLGPMGHHSAEIDLVLRDPGITSVVVVSLLEELPVVESLELVADLKREFGMQPTIVANRVMNSPVTADEIKAQAENSDSPLNDFAKFVLGTQKRQTELLERLKQGAAKVIQVPQVFDTKVAELMTDVGSSIAEAKDL